MKRIYEVRLYPTLLHCAALEFALRVTRELYNAGLQQRREAYRLQQRNVARDQPKELTRLRKEDVRLRGVYRECLDAVLHRLDLAFAAFFRRAKAGAAGFPRFRSLRRWRQLEFPHGNRALRFDAAQSKLYVPTAGWIKVRKGRAVPLTYKRAWLVRKNGRWYAQFECRIEATPLPKTGVMRGYDRGVRVLAASSEGEFIENPRFLERGRLKIERAQRCVARKRKRSKRRASTATALARRGSGLAMPGGITRTRHRGEL